MHLSQSRLFESFSLYMPFAKSREFLQRGRKNVCYLATMSIVFCCLCTGGWPSCKTYFLPWWEWVLICVCVFVFDGCLLGRAIISWHCWWSPLLYYIQRMYVWMMRFFMCMALQLLCLFTRLRTCCMFCWWPVCTQNMYVHVLYIYYLCV